MTAVSISLGPQPFPFSAIVGQELTRGEKAFEPGLLARANRGYL